MNKISRTVYCLVQTIKNNSNYVSFHNILFTRIARCFRAGKMRIFLIFIKTPSCKMEIYYRQPNLFRIEINTNIILLDLNKFQEMWVNFTLRQSLILRDGVLLNNSSLINNNKKTNSNNIKIKFKIKIFKDIINFNRKNIF